MKVNGNLTFATLGSGELRNAIIERLPSAPTAFAGRIYFNTGDNLYYYYNGTTWSAFAAGTPTPAYGTVTGDSGSAPAASSGATLIVAGGTGVATVGTSSPNTLTVNLSLDTKLTAATVATGDFLAFADISASSASRKTSVLNFLNDLDIPNGISANGIVTRTAADTYTARTITGITNRVTVTNGDGVAGAPNIDIAAGYAGQTSITTLGTIATGTWSGTTIAIANGGTGQTSANAALNALLPSQTGNNGKVLQTNGTTTSWQTGGGGGSAAGVTDNIQFNNAGAFAADDGFNFVFDAINNRRVLTIGGTASPVNDSMIFGGPGGISLGCASDGDIETNDGSYIQIAPAPIGGAVNIGTANGLTGFPNGGTFSFFGGAGAPGEAGTGGGINFQGGNGSLGNAGGGFNFQGGSGAGGLASDIAFSGADEFGNGGFVTLYCGDGRAPAPAVSAGAGGYVEIFAGSAAPYDPDTFPSGGQAGGNVSIGSGQSYGDYSAGTINIEAGPANGPGTGGAIGGNVNITSGAGPDAGGTISFRTSGVLVPRLSIDGTGTWLLANDPGADGAVLTSTGAGSAPTWQPVGGARAIGRIQATTGYVETEGVQNVAWDCGVPGEYVITFTTSLFSSTPVVTLGVEGGAPGFVSITALDATSMTIQTYDTTGNPTDKSFTFHALKRV